jgi:excinuclease UvrABC ATPase subunit
MSSPFGNIEVRGARENNHKNISLDIPRRQITANLLTANAVNQT